MATDDWAMAPTDQSQHGMEENQGGWEWTVRIIKEWTEVLTGEHFFFLGAEGTLVRVVHGVMSSENHQERWEAAVSLIAAGAGTEMGATIRNLAQTFKWGAKDIGSVTVTPKDTLQAQVVTLQEFWEMSQQAFQNQAGKFGFLYCEWEPADPRVQEEPSEPPPPPLSPVPGPCPKSPRRPTRNPSQSLLKRRRTST